MPFFLVKYHTFFAEPLAGFPRNIPMIPRRSDPSWTMLMQSGTILWIPLRNLRSPTPWISMDSGMFTISLNWWFVDIATIHSVYFLVISWKYIMEDNLGVQARGDFDAVEPWCLKPRVGIRGPCSYSSTVASQFQSWGWCDAVKSAVKLWGIGFQQAVFFLCFSTANSHESMNILDDDP